MKRLLSLILSAFTVMGISTALGVTSFADDIYIPWDDKIFSDVEYDDWFYEDAVWCTENGILHGFPDRSYRPSEALTRAQFAKVLYEVAGVTDTYEDIKLPFDDVRENSWYSESLRWAYKNGIINGKGDGRFAPDAPVTRAELAAMLFRFITKEQLAVNYVHSDELAPDYEAIPEYAKLPAVFLYRSGLVKGKNGGMFDPKAVTTRAEAAALFRRVLTSTEKQEYALLEKYELSVKADAWLNKMPYFTMEGDPPPPASYFYCVLVDLYTGDDTPADIVPTLELKISPFAGTVSAETVLTVDDWRFDFRVEGEETLLALHMTENAFLVFEYTVTINGESENYMSYVTVHVAY